MNSRPTANDVVRGWNEEGYTRGQGLEVEEVAPGQVIVRLNKPNANQLGGGRKEGRALNGAVIAYMFDGALGYSISSALYAMPEAKDIDMDALDRFTLNLDVTYLNAAFGDRIEAHGKVVRVSKSTAFAEGRLLDANGKVCATAKGIWRIFWPRQQRS